MSTRTAIVWFRHDLRIADNLALRAGIARGCVVPVYIWSPDEEGEWPLGAASRWWLHQSLHALDDALRKLDSRLIVQTGDALPTLRKLIKTTGAEAVLWNRRYEPAAIARDTQVKRGLTDDGIEVESFNASLLNEPWTIQTKTGGPYQVFTPYWKTCLSLPVDAIAPTPRRIPSPAKWPSSLKIDDLKLEPTIDWTAGMRATWSPGETGARKRLNAFIKNGVTGYDKGRDRMDEDGVSMLSPHLHFGEISPRQVWHVLADSAASASAGASTFLAEIGWREFAYHLLYHFPKTPRAPLRAQFAKFPWSRNRKALRQWQRGMTGFPIVDAAMRQLWHTGWMHNRARMIVASFLTKDLLIPWQEGAEWFWDTLVDADLASNTLGWQWTAGCGADAAPYFRIFNPTNQAKKFDPQGNYIRQWVPELAKLPAPAIFEPHTARPNILESVGVKLGLTYPNPIMDHADARNAALAAYRRIAEEKRLTNN
ncbi:MAG: deoxyribodipyrimidine photo-lyase [Phycisphaerales bacterium]|nr:deoxyribodipyrimidine photo-lyase [Phycisphaerales bacterium]